MKIIYDKTQCTGCQACQMACLDQRDVSPEAVPLCRLVLGETGQGLNYQFIHCVHCGACMKVCPSGCLYRDDRGLIQANTDQCIGCQACAAACPLGVISFHPETGKILKCDGCVGRVEAGLLPACVHTCPTGALTLNRN